MPAQTSRHGRHRRPEQETPQAAVAGQRNPQLDSDVACCLGDIEKTLASGKTERETAIEEFREIQSHAGHDGMGSGPDAATQLRTRQWQAKYSHLAGLNVHQHCCGYSLSSDGKVIVA